MRVLVTNHHLVDFAGSELFTRDFVLALKDAGHQVFLYTPQPGRIATEIVAAGVPVTDNIEEWSSEQFDVIHAQHNVTAILARSFFPNTPMVLMVHGIMPTLEQPPSINLGIEHYLAVSEEVKTHLQLNYQIPEKKITIIRNFVDAQRFSPRKPVSSKLKQVLVVSNHYTDENKRIIEAAAANMKLRVTHVGFPRMVRNVEDYINKADLVISLGRGVLEAAACARNVLVFDYFGADGMVTAENFARLREKNFSGRTHRQKLTVTKLESVLQEYDPLVGEKLRKLVLAEHSKEGFVTAVTAVYQEVRDKPVRGNQLGKRQLFNELNYLEYSNRQLIKSGANAEILLIANRQSNQGGIVHPIQTDYLFFLKLRQSKLWPLLKSLFKPAN